VKPADGGKGVYRSPGLVRDGGAPKPKSIPWLTPVIFISKFHPFVTTGCQEYSRPPQIPGNLVDPMFALMERDLASVIQ
jgi:hypothetical protein